MTDTPEPLDPRLQALLDRSPVLAPLAVVGGSIALGLARGPGAAVLGLAGGALLGSIAALWNSLRVLAGDAPLTLHEAIDLGAPTEQQERKQAILLALKDLQREHALGKISDDDFKDMSARYRAEAKTLLRQMDDDLAPARREAEALLVARLAGKTEEPAAEEAPRKKKKKKAERAAEREAERPVREDAEGPGDGSVRDANEAAEEAERALDARPVAENAEGLGDGSVRDASEAAEEAERAASEGEAPRRARSGEARG